MTPNLLRKSVIVTAAAAALTVGGAGVASAHPVNDPQNVECEGPGLSVYGGRCEATHQIIPPSAPVNDWWTMPTLGLVALIILF